MIIIIKNAQLAGLPTATVPYSKLKDAIGACLKKEGYVSEIAKKMKKGHQVLELTLVYEDKKPKIMEVERISKQSRRVYFKMKDIHTIRNGTGLLVLSTPKGIMSGSDARKAQVGGEALFRMW